MRFCVRDGLAGADAEQHVVRRARPSVEVVRVVGGDERQVHLARDPNEPVVDRLLLRHAVAHDFDVEAIAEDVDDTSCASLQRRLVVVRAARLRRTSPDMQPESTIKPVVVLREQVEVDPRLVVVALEEAFRDQRDEVAVADEVGGQQRDVRLVAHACGRSGRAARCRLRSRRSA